jgi:FMN phosphatase YigB (HAD superfamily)
MKKLIIFDLDGVLFNSQEAVWSFMSESYPTLTEGKNAGNFKWELSMSISLNLEKLIP